MTRGRGPGDPPLAPGNMPGRPALKQPQHLATILHPKLYKDPCPFPVPPGQVVLTLTICSDEVLHLSLLIPRSPEGGRDASPSEIAGANPESIATLLAGAGPRDSSPPGHGGSFSVMGLMGLGEVRGIYGPPSMLAPQGG